MVQTKLKTNFMKFLERDEKFALKGMEQEDYRTRMMKNKYIAKMVSILKETQMALTQKMIADRKRKLFKNFKTKIASIEGLQPNQLKKE